METASPRTLSREEEDRSILAALESAVVDDSAYAPTVRGQEEDEYAQDSRWRALLSDTVDAAKTYEAENEALRAKCRRLVSCWRAPAGRRSH
jgi:hypothetical protein